MILRIFTIQESYVYFLSTTIRDGWGRVPNPISSPSEFHSKSDFVPVGTVPASIPDLNGYQNYIKITIFWVGRSLYATLSKIAIT